MNRLKYIIPCIGAAVMMITGGCGVDKCEECGKTAGPKAVSVGGLLTRVGDAYGPGLYLAAFFDSDNSPYFGETPVTFPGGLSTDPDNPTVAVFPAGTPYYPLDVTKGIRLFAYSGKTSAGGNMQLVAGTGAGHDYILSNYGKGGLDAQITTGNNGTYGDANNPADILQFRHVMTQLNVSIIVDPDDPNPPSPLPTTLEMRLGGMDLAAEALYNIRTPDAGDDTGMTTIVDGSAAGRYTIRMGTNYLIPNKAGFTGATVEYLKIDDYTATRDDLEGFTIAPSGTNTPQTDVLMPGYAYNLVITLKKLKVTGITLTKVNWKTKEINDSDITYEPKVLQVSTGAFDQNLQYNGIRKVVLHNSADNGKTYVGQRVGGNIEFVLLPEEADSVDIYTVAGHLVSAGLGSEGNSYTGGVAPQLDLTLSAGGMYLSDPSAINSPANPYLITTPVQFMSVQRDMGGYYRQEVDVDLNTLNLISSTRVFNGFPGVFTGGYDGNGKLIAGLDINASGLFDINQGELVNIRIFSGQIDATGQTAAGSVCGTNEGVIYGCFNEAHILAADPTTVAGGICGQNSSTGTIAGCLNTGNLLAGNPVGGICGTNLRTAENAVQACVNIGMLNSQATSLGGICGASAASPSVLFNTCFWLVGSAQHYIGGGEVAVNPLTAGETVNTVNCSDLDPNELRNQLYPGEPESKRILNRLNAIMHGVDVPPYAHMEFVIDRTATGSTWTVPVKM